MSCLKRDSYGGDWSEAIGDMRELLADVDLLVPSRTSSLRRMENPPIQHSEFVLHPAHEGIDLRALAAALWVDEVIGSA
jgi:hypothetical protein